MSIASRRLAARQRCTHSWLTNRTTAFDLQCEHCGHRTTEKKLFAAKRAAATRRTVRLIREREQNDNK